MDSRGKDLLPMLVSSQLLAVFYPSPAMVSSGTDTGMVLSGVRGFAYWPHPKWLFLRTCVPWLLCTPMFCLLFSFPQLQSWCYYSSNWGHPGDGNLQEGRMNLIPLLVSILNCSASKQQLLTECVAPESDRVINCKTRWLSPLKPLQG